MNVHILRYYERCSACCDPHLVFDGHPVVRPYLGARIASVSASVDALFSAAWVNREPAVDAETGR